MCFGAILITNFYLKYVIISLLLFILLFTTFIIIIFRLNQPVFQELGYKNALNLQMWFMLGICNM